MADTLYQIQSPDATDYWTRMVRCQDACPVHTDACGYVTAIAEGRYEEAYRIARATNPFASICGRVCGAPCELNCRRGDSAGPDSALWQDAGRRDHEYVSVKHCQSSVRGGTPTYFDIACAITTLVLIGKVIEQAKQRAAKTIASLHRMLPKRVRIFESNIRGSRKERFIGVELLRANDRFLVKAGERIPADGVIVEGTAEADESLLTGESEPVAKQGGDTVVAGSLNLSGVLHVRATTVGPGSTIAQIVNAVERALSTSSEIERRVLNSLIAAGAMVVSSLSVIGNSYRLSRPTWPLPPVPENK